MPNSGRSSGYLCRIYRQSSLNMIEKTIHLCGTERLIDLACEPENLAAFLLPEITKHKRDYDVILSLGHLAQIEFSLGEVTLKTAMGNFDSITFCNIRRFTRQRLQYYSEYFADIINRGLHEKPYRPDIEKAFDYDC